MVGKHLVDRGGDDFLFRDRRQAVADASIVGLHLREAHRERNALLHAGGIEHHRHAERRRDDAGDLHSVLMPASFTTAAQRLASSAICAPSSAGPPGAGVAPRFARFSCTSRAFRPARIAGDSFWITPARVPGGAATNTPRRALKPGRGPALRGPAGL